MLITADENQNGFTLVELMVVVAIIGILSAVAIPNFKKYQAKSKQSEAKIQLAALYSAEISIYAEWSTYGTCLVTLGIDPTPKGYYSVGFETAFDATALVPLFLNCSAGSTITTTPTAASIAYLPAVLISAVAANKPTALTDLTGTTTAAELTFKAGAAGSISLAVVRDVWNIDQTKSLTNPTPGY